VFAFSESWISMPTSLLGGSVAANFSTAMIDLEATKVVSIISRKMSVRVSQTYHLSSLTRVTVRSNAEDERFCATRRGEATIQWVLGNYLPAINPVCRAATYLSDFRDFVFRSGPICLPFIPPSHRAREGFTVYGVRLRNGGFDY
jgi:hypothetical protein